MAYNVLIVDDSQTMRRVIRKTLTLSGFDLAECWEAGDGQKALEILRRQPVQLLLTDLNMSGMDGLELLREVRKEEALRELPVVVITTEGGEKRLEEAYALGVDGYLQKPFHPEAIRDILTRVMGKAHG